MDLWEIRTDQGETGRWVDGRDFKHLIRVNYGATAKYRIFKDNAFGPCARRVEVYIEEDNEEHIIAILRVEVQNIP